MSGCEHDFVITAWAHHEAVGAHCRHCGAFQSNRVQQLEAQQDDMPAIAAALLVKLKEECEAQYARAESLAAALAVAEGQIATVDEQNAALARDGALYSAGYVAGKQAAHRETEAHLAELAHAREENSYLRLAAAETVKAINGEIVDFDGCTDPWATAIHDLQQERDQAVGAEARLQAEIDRLEYERDADRRERTEVAQAHARLTAERAAISGALMDAGTVPVTEGAYDVAIRALTAERDQLEAGWEKAEGELAMAEAKLHAADAALARLTVERDHLREEVDRAPRAYVQCGWDYNGLFQRYHEEKARADAADAALLQARQEREKAQRRYQDESRIVDEVWAALGISTYEGAQGKHIATIVKELKAAGPAQAARAIANLRDLIAKWRNDAATEDARLAQYCFGGELDGDMLDEDIGNGLSVNRVKRLLADELENVLAAGAAGIAPRAEPEPE